VPRRLLGRARDTLPRAHLGAAAARPPRPRCLREAEHSQPVVAGPAPPRVTHPAIVTIEPAAIEFRAAHPPVDARRRVLGELARALAEAEPEARAQLPAAKVAAGHPG